MFFMPVNSISISFRRIFRNKVFSAINIGGLAMGIAAFLLLLEYISLEKGVNTFHKDLPQIYRLLNEDKTGNTWAQVEPGWALQAKQRFPQIKEFCRFEEGVAQGIVSAKNDPEKSYREESIGYAEGNFFSFFSFPLREGSPDAFAKPNTVFISAAAAKKYFGNAGAIGKVLTLHNQFGSNSYSVEGVFNNMGDNSDIRYDMLFSYETLKNPANLNDNGWARTDNLESQYIYTYFKLNKETDIASLEKQLTGLRNELKKDKDGVSFRLQAFSNMHLGSSLQDTFATTANIKYVYMLAAIAFLILLIAWFNYINLSTASSIKRAGEVGVRKVIGASQKQLIAQFLTESLLINALAFIAAIAIIAVIQPLFNQLIGRQLSLLTLSNTNIWLYALLLLLVGSVLSGAYTAFSLSKFNPVQTLKGKISKTAGGVLLRKSLVVSQFVISIGLIIATLFIYAQLSYMQNKNLGINTSQVLIVKGPEIGKDSTYKNRRSSFFNSVEAQSFVKSFCASGTVPGNYYNFTTSGFTQPSSQKGDELKTYSFAIIGEKYLPVYEIPLVAGRNFTAEECAVEWDDNSKVMLNETALKQLGFARAGDALNIKVQWDERALDVVGVVKDYNHASVQQKIDPIIFYPQNNNAYFSIRLSADKVQDKVAQLEKLYKSSFTGNPFDYSFLDDNYNKAYAKERQYGNIFYAASAWAIFIACLGLFGLVKFTIDSRVKEIGIRKVLGADVKVIVSLLSKDFLRLVFIAFLIVCPLVWYAMNKWLEDFAYKVTGVWWIFAAGGAVAFLTALLTISLQAVKAAIANPVKSLRTE
jgi:putative ABC transport system permease protein